MSKKKANKKAEKKVSAADLVKRIETLERRVDITRERVNKGPSQTEWQGW